MKVQYSEQCPFDASVTDHFASSSYLLFLLLFQNKKGHDPNKEIGWMLPTYLHHFVPPRSFQEVKFRLGRGHSEF